MSGIRNTNVNLRVTREEKATMERAAHIRQQNVSEMLRDLATEELELLRKSGAMADADAREADKIHTEDLQVIRKYTLIND